MIIIGIDPGQTTGICIIRDLGANGDHPTDFEILKVYQILWEDRFDIGDDIIKAWAQPETYVVMESFNLYPAAASGQAHIHSSFPSVEVIGIVSYACHLYGLPYKMQPPSARGRVQILTKDQETLRGMTHAKDAYRHARYFLLNLYNNKR